MKRLPVSPACLSSCFFASRDEKRWPAGRTLFGHGNAVAVTLLALALLAAGPRPAAAAETLAHVIETAQAKVVKIHGAGGIRNLPAYQSGFLFSSQGHVLTAWSYVLDTDQISVTLADGRRFLGELIGADPRTELAVLKIPVEDVPYFNLDQSRSLAVGERVLAFSNLFGVATGDEPASVQQGRVSARTRLTARRGIFETPYDGPIYVLDAMTSNPGAAGGVLTTLRGELAGVLGKQLQNAQNNTWLNFALPIEALLGPVDDILSGTLRPRAADETARQPAEPWTTARLGLRLVPDVLPNTPPFIDRVLDGTPAAHAGLQPDDLILYLNQRAISSCQALHQELALIDRIDPLHLTVQRGNQLLDLRLQED